jgi:uncharacterized protein (TIGR02246 family)
VATGIAKALEAAWNGGDGETFADSFADFVDFIDIRGEYHRGRRGIAYAHVALFDTIFKGSVISYDPVSARLLSPDILLSQVRATLKAPVGPLAGENQTTLSLVARKKGEDWRIELFHNTLIPKDLTEDERKLRESIH